VSSRNAAARGTPILAPADHATAWIAAGTYARARRKLGVPGRTAPTQPGRRCGELTRRRGRCARADHATAWLAAGTYHALAGSALSRQHSGKTMHLSGADTRAGRSRDGVARGGHLCTRSPEVPHRASAAREDDAVSSCDAAADTRARRSRDGVARGGHRCTRSAPLTSARAASARSGWRGRGSRRAMDGGS
jgi:hypothetical protein